MLRRAARFGVILLVATACGGRVSGGDDPEREREPSIAPGDDDDDSATNGSDNGANADTPLGECIIGRPETESIDEPCAWVAEDRCYETREMACNCACPRDRDSQCYSGIPGGPRGRVWVNCD